MQPQHEQINTESLFTTISGKEVLRTYYLQLLRSYLAKFAALEAFERSFFEKTKESLCSFSWRNGSGLGLGVCAVRPNLEFGGQIHSRNPQKRCKFKPNDHIV